MKDFWEDLKLSILAGMSISIGTFAYLVALQKVQNIILASCMFYLGLLMVIILELNLFTGKIFTASDKGIKDYIKILLKTFIGNVIGSIITTVLLFKILKVDVNNSLIQKLSSTPIEILIKGMFCNLFVCLAIWNFKYKKNYLISGFFIMSFVLLGFYHSIADITYFTIGFMNKMNIDIKLMLSYFIFCIIGNIIGGLILKFRGCKV